MKEYFRVDHRNPGHWDIWDESKRLCKIRGEAGSFCVYNDWGNFTNKEGFKTVAEAMQYICGHLMNEDNYLGV